MRKTKSPLETRGKSCDRQGSPESPLRVLNLASFSLVTRYPLPHQGAGGQNRACKGEGKLTSVGFMHDFRRP